MALSAEEQKELESLRAELKPKAKAAGGLSQAEAEELEALKSELGPIAQNGRLSGTVLEGAQTPSADTKTKAEAGLQGFGQAATFGYLPNLQAAAEKPLAKIYEFATGNKVETDDYVKSRDQFIKRDEGLAEAAPGAYLAGQVAGSVTTPGLGAVKGASTAGKIGKAALTGAATGALYNPGDEEGKVSGIQGMERLENAGKGLLTGGVAQGVASAGGRALSGWANKGKGLEKASNTMALTAAGAKTGELKKLYDKKTIDQVGEFLKKEKLVGPRKTVNDTLEGANVILGEAGQEISNIYSKSKGRTLSPSQMSKELNDVFTSELKGKPGGRQILARVQSELENLKDLGDEAGLDKVLEFRRGIDDLINYDKTVRDMPGSQQALKKMRDFLKEKIEKEVAAVDPKDASRLKELNKRYWGAAEVESIGKKAVSREESKMVLGIPELMVGTAVGGTGAINDVAQGNPEDALYSVGKGLLAAGAVKAGRKFGPGAMAIGADKIGRGLQMDPTGRLAAPAAQLLGNAPAGLIGGTAERIRGGKKKKKRDSAPIDFPVTEGYEQ